MYDYAGLPSLNVIFGYLSVKERVKCKSVCRTWKAEIELREKKSDTLVLHSGPYLWNIRWSQTNNRGLMKFENSFEMKQLAFLEHPLTRSLLEHTKKLAIVHFCKSVFNPASNMLPYIGYFKQCEEIEIKNLHLKGTLTFDLPKLKVLVINDSPAEKLVLNCPSLEVLSWNWEVEEIHFQNVKKLKRLVCFDWPARVLLRNKLEGLEYLNLIVADEMNDHLLDLMPNLKRFVLYSRNPQTDLESVRRQRERYGLSNLEILPSGFRDSVGLALTPNMEGVVALDRCVERLFENYSKLAENSPWRFCIDYSQLFSKFKILPSNFFERFNEPHSIEISAVTNYTHLFEFFRCYPFMQQLKIHFSKVKADLVLDMMLLLQPSLRELTIVEERPSDVLKIDFSFMLHFNLVLVNLESTRLPVEFIRKVAAKKGPHFTGIAFEEITTGHRLAIYFSSQGVLLFAASTGLTPNFSSVQQLIAFMQNDRDLSTFLLM